MTYDLNVAVRPELGLTVDESLASSMINVIRDGVSWEDWNQTLDDDSLYPRLVTYRVDSLARALGILAVIHDKILPNTFPGMRGVIAVITDSHGDIVHTVIDTDAKAQAEALVNTMPWLKWGLWLNPAWQQYIASRTEEE